MVGFFERLFGRHNSAQGASGTGKMAKDRLQFVLVQDRIHLPADQLQAMKSEILEVISKYVHVDIDHVDFALSNRERDGLLIAEIPFKPVDADPTSDKAQETELDDSHTGIEIEYEDIDEAELEQRTPTIKAWQIGDSKEPPADDEEPSV